MCVYYFDFKFEFWEGVVLKVNFYGLHWAALRIWCLESEKRRKSDLKLVNNGCKGRWSSAAVLQQAHASVVVADVCGKNQELRFSGQEDVCNPLALLPERRSRGERMEESPQVTCNAFWAALMSAICGRKGICAHVVLTASCGARVSPVSDSVLQLVEDSAVQGVNIRQLIENLSQPLFIQHGFPLVSDCCPHRFPKVLAHRGTVIFSFFVQNLTKLTISLKSAVLPCFFFPSSTIVYHGNIWQQRARELLYQEISTLIRTVEQWWSGSLV